MLGPPTAHFLPLLPLTTSRKLPGLLCSELALCSQPQPLAGHSAGIHVPGTAGHWPGAWGGVGAASPHAVQAEQAGPGLGE